MQEIGPDLPLHDRHPLKKNTILECAIPCSAQDVVVPARGKLVVLTDLAIAVPEGTYGRVAPRSGLAAKHHAQGRNRISAANPGIRILALLSLIPD